ncbi:glycosyltransferase family 4 protein [Rubrivirga litoralis]|uniref:Glycosyltransferase family 4 protein n=1 Tax=Rubrivirga litoralis TaxID=3075598 RepID=A0ABU3BSE6_9BACT|nr:glycosyltransferase family 4 protein [Rubrivirga sp. F394]MDT0632207.1 glycosyltransferase family 4 protein [Rubrivirga sp. F394]
MRIALFSPASRDAVQGGAESVFAALAASFAAEGHDVTRIHAGRTFHRDLADGGPVWSVPLERSRTWRGLARPRSATRVPLSALRLARCLRSARPDVVNVHFVDALAAYVLALQPLFGYRVVLTAHGSDVLRPRSEVHAALVPRLLDRADAVIAVSGEVGDHVRSVAPSACVSVIQNGVDLAFWSGGAGWEPTPGRIVQVGTLRAVKGQDVMLRALARLRDRLPSARLDLIGDGPARDRLQALADELGVADAVTFVGRVPSDEIRERLRTAAVSALPSRSEGLPLTLLEAMAVGTPVVASAVGGIPETAGVPPCAVLVPPEDPERLASALLSVLTDSEEAQALADRAAERVEAFSWSRVVRETENVLAGN